MSRSLLQFAIVGFGALAYADWAAAFQ